MIAKKERTIAKCQDDHRLAYLPDADDKSVVLVSCLVVAQQGRRVAHWQEFTLGQESFARREAFCDKCDREKEWTLDEIERHLASGKKKPLIFRSPFPGRIE